MNEIKRLSEADYDEIFALSQFAFQYELTDEAMVKKREEANRHIIWGTMSGNQLAAKLHLIPLPCYINGKEFDMGGISAVATWPEYRRKGSVKKLLEHALYYMKEHGQIVSYLHPFSIPFYRKYGWELVFTEKKYTIPTERLKIDWKASGYVRRTGDFNLLQAIYTDYAKQFNGPLVRDAKWWEQRVLTGKLNKAVAYNEENQAEGYILYKVKDEVVTVEELAYRNLNGQKVLLQFIGNHDSMAEKVEMVVPEDDNLALLIDEPRFDQKVEPYFMARIVDVPAFLKQYPFAVVEDQSVTLSVGDSFIPENNGTYRIMEHEGETTVTVIENQTSDTVHCTIQQLTSMMLGYKRPGELYRLGLLDATPEQIEKLERLIPNQQTFFPDFF